MDRLIVSPSAIALDTDILSTNKNMMLAMGRLAQDMLGVGTSIGGAACTPGTGLTVVVAPGGIYSFQNVDNNAYGSLGTDTAHQTVKQGTLFNAATLSCPAPTVAGQSINYLIEGQYQELDTNAAVVPYYNSANPLQPFQGPGNNGLSQNTLRQGLFVVQVKAGVSATTGSQVTPTPDSGWTGMYVVTVAFGASVITTGNIVVYSPTPFIGVTALNALSQALAATLYLPLTNRTAAEIAGSVTPSTLAYLTAPFADVRRYGVIADGTTDDTAALQVAFNVAAATGLALMLPAGFTVKITGYVQIFSNTTFYLLGKLQLTNRASGLFANGASNIRIYGNKIGQITDTTVAGAYVWNPIVTIDAPSIHLRSVTNVIVEGLNISYVSAGIYVTNCTTNTATPGGAFVITQASPVNVTLRDNNITFTEYGAMSAYVSVNLKYENNYVYRCGDGGIWMMGCTDSAILGNTRVSPATVPADVVTFGRNSLAHPTTWNDEQGIELENCQNVLIADNTVTQFWGFGISVSNGSNRVSIERNRVSYCENASIITRDGDAIKNANHKIRIISNTITNQGTPQYNSVSGAGTGAIRTGETYICDIIDNVIYGYQTTLGISCLGPETYLASQYAANPQQSALTVCGNTVEFKNAFQEQDAIPEYQFTSTTLSAINITGFYTSVACNNNHIRTDRYLTGDTRFNAQPAINLTYTTTVISSSTYYFPTAAAINSNVVQGWGNIGINVLGLAAMAGSGLTCNDNSVNVSAGAGISLQFTGYAVCSNNSINQPGSGAGAPGIALAGSSGSLLTGVQASGNTCVGGWATGNAMTYGIALSWCTAMKLANNSITGAVTSTFQVSNCTGELHTSGSTGFPRSGAAVPGGTVTSFYTGEPYLATGSSTWYFATAGNTTVWAQS